MRFFYTRSENELVLRKSKPQIAGAALWESNENEIRET